MVLGKFGGTPMGQTALGALYQRLRMAEKWGEANDVFWRAKLSRGDWDGYEAQEGYTSEELRACFEKGSTAYYKAHVQDDWTEPQKRAFRLFRRYVNRHKEEVFKENWWGYSPSTHRAIRTADLFMDGKAINQIEFYSDNAYDICGVISYFPGYPTDLYGSMSDIPDADCEALAAWIESHL